MNSPVLQRDDRGHPDSAPELPSVITVSNSLRQALTSAAGDLPRNRSLLTNVDLLLAIAQGKGSGANFLRYALTMTTGDDGSIYNPRSLAQLVDSLRNWQGQTTPAEPVAGTLQIGDATVPIGMSLRDLLAISRQIASAQPVETGDVVAGDASSAGSVLVPILSAWGAEVAGAVLPRYAGSDYSKRQEDFEDGANSITFQASAASTVPTSATKPGLVAPPPPSGHPASHDLLAEAKARADRPVVRPELASSIIEALDQLTLVVLVTQAAYESDALVWDLANLIASDDGGVLHYKNLIAADSNALDGSPYSTLSMVLNQAHGGIAYARNLQEYLADNNVSGLVQKALGSDTKLIVSMLTADWKTEQGKPFYRRARAILPPAPKADEIKWIFLARKSELERQHSQGDWHITISDQAIAELARLTAKYPVDPLELLTTSAVGVRMSESQGLKKLQRVAFNADKAIDPVDIDLALEKMTGIVVAPEDPERYLHMADELKKSIIDQDQAIHVVSEAIITALGGIKDPKRPTGAFIFMGPTGVGKSEMARALTIFLFNDPNGALRFDMSEYMEKHEVARLIGAPPGYIGYEEGGQLTEAVRRKPYSVVLFDEFEKAHPDVINATLQILEEGKLTDGKGQVTDFSNTIIIFTGNVGAETYQLIGQTDNEGKVITEERVKDSIREQIRKTFRPEFLNRIGDENAEPGESNIVIFNTLKREDMLPIEEIELGKMNKLLAENGLTLSVSDDLKAQLAQEGYSEQYGARPLVRLIKRKLGFPIAQKTLRREFSAGDKISATLVNGEITFSK
jgi:hypothetical protein